jgi:hypothetical protein
MAYDNGLGAADNVDDGTDDVDVMTTLMKAEMKMMIQTTSELGMSMTIRTMKLIKPTVIVMCSFAEL